MLYRLIRPRLLSYRLPCSQVLGTRQKRYDAFDAELDPELLNEARKWNESFDPSQLPKGSVTYARSSGPGGQHVNKTESKAISVFPVKDLVAILPRFLHGAIRSSQFYTAGSDSLTFQAQTHRSRSDNADENRRKLMAEISKLYSDKVPAESSPDKKEKHKQVENRFHQSRLKQKKFDSAKKQSRRGPSD